MLTILCLQGFEFDIFVEANYKLVLSWTCSWDEVEYVDKDLLEHLDTAISRSLSLPAPAHMLFNMKIPRELYRDWVDAWYQSLLSQLVSRYILWLIHVQVSQARSRPSNSSVYPQSPAFFRIRLATHCWLRQRRWLSKNTRNIRFPWCFSVSRPIALSNPVCGAAGRRSLQ